MIDELKPCICGNNLYYEETSLGINAHCTNKKCALYGKQLDWLNVEAWNMRPQEDKLRAEIARLREELDDKTYIIASLLKW